MSKKLDAPTASNSLSAQLSAQAYTQQLVECTTQLMCSQLDVTTNIYNEVSQECRDLLKSTEPAAIFASLPKIMEKTVRSTTEGANGLVANALGYQKNMFQLMQNGMPEWNRPA